MVTDVQAGEPGDESELDVNKKHLRGWTRLKWAERGAILLAVVVISAVSIPRLPPGVCYGDAGDLQLASATLGIAHPPGYTAYVTMGHIVTLIPFVDPAYLISLACLGAGIVALTLCMLIQVRLGVNAWIAAAGGLMLAVEPHVWQNLLAPEVYGPSLAVLAGSTYLLLRYDHTARHRDLLVGALLFGVAAINRPPLAAALPFGAIALWTVWRRRNVPLRGMLRRAASAALVMLLPGAYAIGYLWFRDTPDTACNYIEQYNAEAQELPNAAAGARAKARRVLWLASGEQYRDQVGTDWAGLRAKLRWLRGELAPGSMLFPPLDTVALLLALAGCVVGLVLAVRRCAPALWLALGMMFQSVVFVSLYRIWGQAADLLPLLWALAAMLGVALSVMFPRESTPARQQLATGLALLTCAWTVVQSSERPSEARAQSAVPFVEAVDLATFPPGAVICSSWGTSTPLWYAQHVLAQRDDIRIINAGSGSWLQMAAEYAGRPVFVTDPRVDLPDGYRLAPFRKLWRVEQTR